jgi:cytochrome c553
MKANCLLLTLLLGAVGLPTLGCDHARDAAQGGAMVSNATTRSKTPAVEAREILAERCSPCHGAEGKGDGPAAGECDPRPPNLTDRARQSRLSDQELERLILLGGKATGRSNHMPPNSDLEKRRPVLAALVTLVRDLGTK